MSQIPPELHYTEEHEYLKLSDDADVVFVGITDYAQHELGDVVYVDLPEVGDSLEINEPFGSVESVKAVSELFMPLGGEVKTINEVLGDSPELVNNAPYTEGWMLELAATDPSEFDQLMDRAAYLEMLKGSQE